MYGYFAVGTALDLASIPILLDISLALFSKLLSDDVQGFGHAVRRFLSSFALLIGPLWGSGSLPWLYLLFGTPLLLILISAVLVLLSFKQMLPLSQQSEDLNTTTSQTVSA